MFHCAGWTFPWSVTAVGGVHVCLRKIDYAEIWRYLTEEGVTHYNAAPTVNLNLLNHPAATKLDRPVRVTVAGSAPSAPLFKKMFSYNLQPVHVYGLTEVYGPSTKAYFLPSYHDHDEDKLWTSLRWQGHGFLGARDTRVVKQTEGGLEDVRRDGKEVGQVVFRGNIVMKGYLFNKAETEKAFKDGWFWSGDLAVVHPEGQIELVDREKDIIISGSVPFLIFWMATNDRRGEYIVDGGGTGVVGESPRLRSRRDPSCARKMGRTTQSRNHTSPRGIPPRGNARGNSGVGKEQDGGVDGS
jgi:acyl-CoA synthetase (AMP-forming)/AMP-acid ligase II